MEKTAIPKTEKTTVKLGNLRIWIFLRFHRIHVKALQQEEATDCISVASFCMI